MSNHGSTTAIPSRGLLNTVGCPCCAYSDRQFSALTLLFSMTATRRDQAPSEQAPFPTRPIVLDGGTVVDPRKGTTITNTRIRINDGRITDVAPNESGRPRPSGELIDITGKFVVPGYNDMHSHALNLRDPAGSLALMLAEGVTGFRQMSGSESLLDKRRNGTLPIGPAAPALLATPGAVLTPLNAGSPAAAAAEIQRQRDQGADFVKLVLTSPEVLFAALEAAASCGLPVVGHLQEGVDAVAAARAGFRSVEHLGPGSSVWASCSAITDELIRDGQEKSNVKGPPFKIPLLDRIVMWRMQNLLVNPAAFSSSADVDRIRRALDRYSDAKAAAVAAQFIEHGTWQVPTLVRLRTMQLAGAPEYERDGFLDYMPPKNIKRWRKVTRKFLDLPVESRATYRRLYFQQLHLTKVFADTGVRMMTGTDGGFLSGPGLTLRQEFAELAKAGLSPLKILQMSTVEPAEFLGRQTSMGTVEVGRNADLVVLEADPLAHVGNLHRIHAVVRAGRYFPASKLERLQTAVAAGRGTLKRE